MLIPFRESNVFFKVIPGALDRSVNFNITQKFPLKRPVFAEYPFLVTMVKIIYKEFFLKKNVVNQKINVVKKIIKKISLVKDTLMSLVWYVRVSLWNIGIYIVL